jgi:hypothetical protein
LTLLLSRDVKQVLLEFQFFELMPPKEGNCIDDQFTISNELGSMNHQIPILCGTASGQHSKNEVDLKFIGLIKFMLFSLCGSQWI